MRHVLSILLALIIGIGMVSSTVVAGEHPDFTGTYVLDLSAPESTSMAPLLETQGASWMERKLADSVSVTQKYIQNEKTLTILVENPIAGNKTEVLNLDGSPEYRDTGRLGRVEARSSWDKDGKAVVTVIKYTTPDGKKAEWVTRRYLADGGKKIMVDHVLTLEDGRKLTARRVLRKK